MSDDFGDSHSDDAPSIATCPKCGRVMLRTVTQDGKPLDELICTKCNSPAPDAKVSETARKLGEPLWCAACGKHGDHGSGSCPTISHDYEELLPAMNAHRMRLEIELSAAKADAANSTKKLYELNDIHTMCLESTNALRREFAALEESNARMLARHIIEKSDLTADRDTLRRKMDVAVGALKSISFGHNMDRDWLKEQALKALAEIEGKGG